jgi:hypothetical protein
VPKFSPTRHFGYTKAIATKPQTRFAVRSLALTLTASLLLAAGARADVFVLQEGGQVRGELINKNETPRKNYTIKTATGGHVLLSVDQVASVAKQSPAQLEYDRIRWQHADTVEDQWKLAEWCREKKLNKERKEPLARILELDPNHEDARHALNYRRIKGKWVNEREYMEGQGYIRHNGRWITQQEFELIGRDRKVELAQKEWLRKLKRWRDWLNDDEKAAEGRQNLLAIDDPHAAKGLANGMKNESVREVTLIYVEALAKIGAPNALDVLVVQSIENDDEEVRVACLDKIVRANYSGAVPAYVQKLKDNTNRTVNRAAEALGNMKDPSSVGPLIDALITTHKETFTPPNPGQMSTSFTGGVGGGPGGFSFGQPKEQIIQKRMANQSVLNALVTITKMNFNFDVVAWKAWFAAQRKPATLDARRD